MTSEEELRIAAEALEESIVVVGWGDRGTVVADEVAARDGVATATDGDPDAVLVAADLHPPVERCSEPPLPAAPFRLAVVTLPTRPTSPERDALEALRSNVDAVLVAPNVTGTAPEDALSGALEAVLGLLRDSGFVNLDLADARTVLGNGETAVLGRASGRLGDYRGAERTVDDAIDSTVPGFDLDRARGVLLDLVGGRSLSVDDVSAAVSAVHDRIGPGAHCIWGGAVEETYGDRLDVRVIVAGVEERRPVPGDPCPRCETPLSAYTFGNRTTVACDRCGYGDVSVRL